MRVHESLVAPADHYTQLSGQGYGNVHAFIGRGGGWLSSLVSMATPMLKTAAHAAASSGLQHLAQGGSVKGAMQAAMGAGGASAMGSAKRKLAGGGYKRARPF